MFPFERRGLNVLRPHGGSIDKEHTYKSECLMLNLSLEINSEETFRRFHIIAMPRSNVCVSGLGCQPCSCEKNPQRIFSAG